ncbi:DUF4982 domain-containing protein [Galbibacter sp. EGI 63066]|uniref:glycoside hydrolase family 2 protein n=1 Tax=Galbibacter sp. EGI 63066 TaxID=2993559 RepID=UPI00224975B3|nr:sugar-binding domain-containing protein [Galbibacter sp. EGI 63066]MCX2679815.1 DUF4982 domain-containing protein [Galbibacter sp. EGI 63066]
MKIKKLYLIICGLAFLIYGCSFSFPDGENKRDKFNFNHGWKLHIGDVAEAKSVDYNDTGWTDINLPYAWNQSEAFKLDIRDLSTGIAWYRKTFQLPEGVTEEKVFIEFEGVRQMGEVYVNGKFVGRSENGVMAFGFDLTPHVKPYPHENIIAVKTDNDWGYKEKSSGSGFQWSDRNFNVNYGGIPKNVFLHITPKVYQTLPLYSALGTTGTYVYASDINIKEKKATVNVSSQVKNESSKSVDAQLRISIEDMEGNTVSSFPGETYTMDPDVIMDLTASSSVENLNFWSWGYGYLYNVYSELLIDDKLVDRVEIRTGFRKTKFQDGMIWLNDRVIMMKGYAQRTSNEWPAVGMSVPAWLSDYSNKLMIESSANLVRWMHITPWKQDIESCDRVGLIQAMPAGDSEGDVKGRRWEQRKEVMRDAIIYNRNNPSILFYECGNESISEEHMSEMREIRNQYDSNGGRAIGSREMLDSEVAEYGGEMLYINKSADIPFWAMEYSRDEGLRKYWDEFTPPYHKDGDGPLYKGEDASIYNRNQDSHAIEDVVRWFDYWEMRPGTGERVSSGGVNIIFSDTNTHHRGEENYRRSGEVDPMRIPKENYFAHKVIWDGWVDTDTPNIHIIGHWNYEAGVVKDITVVSTADEVELFVNNESLGKGEQSKRFLFTFKDVAFKPGSIKSVGYDKEGEVVCETGKTTSGAPYGVKLTSVERPGGMLADGSDLTIVQVEVVDKDGNRCPTALNMIDFDVEGEGVFIGGIAQGPDNYVGAESLPVEAGVNRIFVRSTEKVGEIKVKATSEGLKSDEIGIKTIETDIQKLSEVMPDDELPSNLEKGPTPTIPSYQVSRTPIKIVGAETVTHVSDVDKSYDDNEFTEWRNEGNKNAVIEYELEREADINQAVIKFAGWRRRSYPLKIYVDDKEVYHGMSPLSLGYVTFTFPPTTGKRVRVELVGRAQDSDNINIIEITGKVDQAGLKSRDRTTGKLRIIEIEFYEPVSNSISDVGE